MLFTYCVRQSSIHLHLLEFDERFVTFHTSIIFYVFNIKNFFQGFFVYVYEKVHSIIFCI